VQRVRGRKPQSESPSHTHGALPPPPPQDDIVCGNRAGAVTVLLDVDGRYAPGGGAEPAGEAVPTHTVASMAELQVLLEARYTLLPPARDEAAAADAAAAGAPGGGQ
jgi:hypothetical protein